MAVKLSPPTAPHFLSEHGESEAWSVGCTLTWAVGRGTHPAETQDENQRKLRVPRRCMCSPPDRPGEPSVLASSDIIAPDGRNEGLGQVPGFRSAE